MCFLPNMCQIRAHSRPRRPPQWRRRQGSRPCSWVGGPRGRTGKKHTKTYTLSKDHCQGTVLGSMSQNIDRALFFGYSCVDLNAKVLCRRYSGRGRILRRHQAFQAGGGGTPRRINRAKRRSKAVDIRLPKKKKTAPPAN